MDTGIYQIRNLVNDNIYVGSAVDISQRWWRHTCDLRKNKHHSQHLQRAWNKYGKESFELSILEECEPVKETLLDREQYYLDTFRPEYNICPKAYSCLGIKRTEENCVNISKRMKGNKYALGTHHTPEELAKIVEAAKRNWTPERRAKKSVAMMGNKNALGAHRDPPSEETRLKISRALTGHFQPKMTEETRAKISQAQKERWASRKKGE